MPHNRFFVADIHHPEFSDEEVKHFKVMRLRDGEVFELVDGQGHLALASCTQKNITIHEMTKDKEWPSLIIAQGIPRPNRIDIILEKGCELGMTKLILFPAELSEKKDISDNQFKRYETILINAMKQSGRLYLPKLNFVTSLDEVIKNNKDKELLFGDVSKGVLPLGKMNLGEKGIVFFVGPEKGFSDKEEKKLKDSGVKGVSLSPFILRTDTAPLAALSIISNLRM